MLTKRIIPCLDVDSGKVVKGTNFANLRYSGNPSQLADYYNKQGADELVLLDISATTEGRNASMRTIRKVAGKLFIPLAAGGGITSLEGIRNALANGADKVCINTAAVLKPRLIKEASKRFGSQCVVVAIDAKRDEKRKSGKGRKWEVYIRSGTKRTGLDAVKWAVRTEQLGAGELLITSIDRDGTKKGYDLKLIREIAEAVNIPVIASGGAGSMQDMADVFIKGKADAALAASILHYKKYSIKQIKQYLRSKGILVRTG